MSLMIELPPELEARFRAEAGARGLPLQAFMQEWLARHAPAEPREPISSAEAERLFDELVESLPDMPVLSEEALRRENLYSDEGDR